MKQTLFFFLFVVLFTSLTYSQIKVSGLILDAETNDRLFGANVTIGDNITSTNESGEFSFSNVKVGLNKIKISYVGYETLEKEINITSDAVLNYSLLKKEIYSKQIVVTASRNEQTIGDVAGRISMINNRTITSLPQNSTDDLLKTSSAVFVDRSSGIFTHSSVVSIRGITAGEQGRVLALIDGQPINKSDGGTVNWNRINPENVERIEVFKGPGSSVYGNNAMGGVVNVITKKNSKAGYHGFGETSYSSFNTIEEKLTLSGRLANEEGLTFRISGFNRTSDGYNTYREAYRDAFSIDSDLKEVGVDGKVGYDFNSNTNIVLSYNYYDDTRGQGTKVREENIMKHKTNYGSLSFNTQIASIKINANAFLQAEDYLRVMEKYKASGTVISSYDLIDVDANRDDYGANINVTLPLEANYVNAGFEFKIGSIDGSDNYITTYNSTTKQYMPGTDILTNKGKMTTIAGYIADEWKILDQLKINAGLRYDKVKFHDGEYILTNPSKNNEFLTSFAGPLKEADWSAVTPKISAQYAFLENLKSYLAYSQGFRAGTLDDITRPGLIKLGFKNANPNLKPEKIENFELGLNYDLNQSLYIMPSVYYMTGKDFMAYLNTGKTINISGKNRPIIVKDNISKVEFLGGDIDLRYFISSGLTTFANFAYTKTKIKNFDGNTGLVGKELTYTPKYLSNVGVTYLNEIVNGTLNVHYQSKQYLNDDNSEKDSYGNSMIIDANTTVDLKLWKRFYTMINVFVEVQNLFNVQTLSTYDRYSIGRFITGGISVEL